MLGCWQLPPPPPLLLLLLLLAAAAHAAPKTKKLEILMPGVSPQQEDTYLCTAVRSDERRFIREFVPRHESGHAHHIILTGCSEPGSRQKVWNCGEMLAAGGAGGSGDYEVAPQCADGTKMLYAYAMDAPALKLPDGVTFGVGDDFQLPWLVVQVHYKKAEDFKKDKKLKDYSGVEVAYQLEPSPKLGGIHLSLTDGEIPAHSVTYMQTACTYTGGTELHPFAFRTHTHSHGRVVSGFRVRDGRWTLIGSGNPQLPQMFYAVNNSATVRPGDAVAARCVMENSGSSAVAIGATQQDEMCNFYMMYWIRAQDAGKDGSPMCFSSFNGADGGLWGSAPEQALAASATVPGTGQVLREFYEEVADMRRQMQRLMQEMQAAEATMSETPELIDY